MHSIKAKIPGFLAAVAIAGMAIILGKVIPGLGFILSALIIGVLFGNLVSQSPNLIQGLNFTEKKVLELAIVFIGFGFDGHHLTNLSGS